MWSDELKGYWLDGVYMGYIPSKKRYMKFVSPTEYYEYFVDFEVNIEEE